MPKFTLEDHEKRMKEILTTKPREGKVSLVLQRLLDKAKTRKGKV